MFVIAELLGVPSSDYADFRRWSDAMMEAGGSGPSPESLATAGELFAYMIAKVAERRARPREDVLSTLALAELDGVRLTDPHRFQIGNDDSGFVIGGQNEDNRPFADMRMDAADVNHIGARH
jgi:hypothetical protein